MIGGTLGVTIMCLLQINRINKFDLEQKEANKYEKKNY